jgi:4-hydroxybenzoate polyprenyltransferase
MRSAGCIVNDIADKEIDRKVLRTKNRPIASGKISIKIAILYTSILCFLALLVLLNFNHLTIFLAIGSMPLAFTYPLMKRFTYWPQLFLGITFNYGLILGWTAIKSEIHLLPLILYFGAIFWTLAYDTIYGFQDIKDDEIIGVKSTSIKFKKNPTYFLTICLLFFSSTLLIIGYMMNFNSFYFLSLLFVFFHLFLYQVRRVNLKDAQNCLKLFKSNNYLGFFTYICLLIGKLNL